MSSKEIDWDQYNNLNNQKSSTESQISSVQNENRLLNEQIDRLYQVKEIIKTEKGEFDDIKKSVEQIIDEGYEWKGDTYDKFKSNGSYLKEDNNSYYNSIDDVLDAVNDKITELENRIYSNEGLLGQLQSWWNSLCNSIENLFN